MILTAIPWVISAASVVVAAWAIHSNKKLAYKQALFDRMSKNYEDFLIAFSGVAYDMHNPEKRDALSHALYRAVLFSSSDTRKSLQFFADHALGARSRAEFIALESELMTDFLSDLNKDLRKIWKTGKISKFTAPKDRGTKKETS